MIASSATRKTAASIAAYASRAKTLGDRYLVCSAPVPERNRGDQALLHVVVEKLSDLSSNPLTVLTTSSQPITSLTDQSRCRTIDRYYPIFLTQESLREQLTFPFFARQHREMLVIGADVLDEGYSIERSIATMNTLQLAVKSGIKTRIFGFSVNGVPSKGLTDRISRLAHHTRLMVRDPVSFRRLKNAGIDNVEQVGDLAFLLDPASKDTIDSATFSFCSKHAKKLVGLNLTSVVMGHYKQASSKINMLAAACRKLARTEGWRFLLIPHDEPEGIEFLQTFQELLEEPSIDEPTSHLVSDLPHCTTLKCLAGLCKHLFTCRLHLGIAALGMGTPVTGFPYQGKFEGQFELFQLAEDGLISPDELPDASNEMVRLMAKRFDQNMALRNKILDRLPDILRLSEKNFDGIGAS